MSTSPVPGSQSQASLSPANSQVRSTSSVAEISLDVLVAHLLASKRSLSSISSVWRANEIVTSARTALEGSVILGARTAFVRKGIAQQTRILRRVRDGVESVYRDGQRDFEDVLQSLDAADIRLQKTMDVLRSTIVEAAFRPADESPRSLLDFIDENSVEVMRTALKDSIDRSQESAAEFHSAIQSYTDDLGCIKSALPPSKASSPSSSASTSSSIPPLLHILETHASEMASLLDSLVSHFDLCVSAIKHTEGGVTAVQDAANAHLITLSGVMGSPSNSTHLTPISDEDRAEMLAVVSNDASEVEDVVLELQQRLANMEETLDGIVSHVNSLTEEYTSTTSAFALLDSISAKMPTYIQHSATYLATWDGHKSQIISLMDELEHTRVFYEGYLTSYDGLILEVERRRKVEDKMKSVLRKAMEHVEKLARDDHKEREGFRKEAGDYLPGDLWPGLRGDAPQWEIGIVGPEGADEATAYGGEETPELGKGIVEAAVRRDRERSRS